jgi:hypothetical protein
VILEFCAIQMDSYVQFTYELNLILTLMCFSRVGIDFWRSSVELFRCKLCASLCLVCFVHDHDQMRVLVLSGLSPCRTDNV